MKYLYILILLSFLLACNSSKLPPYTVQKDPSPQLHYRYVDSAKGYAFDFPYYGHRFFKSLDEKAIFLCKKLNINQKDIVFYESTYMSHHIRMMVLRYDNAQNTEGVLQNTINNLKKNKYISSLKQTLNPVIKIKEDEVISINDYKIVLDSTRAIAHFTYKSKLDKADFLNNEYFVRLKDGSLLRMIIFVNVDKSLYDESDRPIDSVWFYRQCHFNLSFLKEPIPPLDSSLHLVMPFKLTDSVFKKDKNNPYLASIKALERDSLLYDTFRKEYQSLYFQTLSQQYSVSGFQDEAMAIRDTALGNPRSDDCPNDAFKGYQPIDAIDFISKQLPNRRLVMINEAHHMPMHRIMVMLLLDSLKKHGFKYLALEALSHKHTTNKKGYPTLEDGFYTREPMMGELIRQAKEKGFQLVAYEDDNETECIPPPDAHRFYCHNLREQRQAYFIENIFKRDPKAKVCMLVGYDHNYKNYYLAQRARREGQKWKFVGLILKERGYNPLSINQSDMIERSVQIYENPAYRCAWLNFAQKNPIILVKNDSSWIKPDFETMLDAYVFSPRTGRETPLEWLEKLGYKKQELDLKDVDRPYFVQIFYDTEYQNEGINAVPALNIPTYWEQKISVPLLPNKSYVVKVFSEENVLLKTFKIQSAVP